jgi:hypothetical protein
MKRYFPLFITFCLTTAGCGRTDAPATDAPQPSPIQQQGLDTPITPLADRPAPDVAKGPVPEYPKPGQVNNHSSPDFKGGGASNQK